MDIALSEIVQPLACSIMEKIWRDMSDFPDMKQSAPTRLETGQGQITLEGESDVKRAGIKSWVL